MKKLLVLLMVVIFLSGCETTIESSKIKETYNGSSIQVYTIDSCEYIVLNHDYRSLTHKGNCKFCKQRNK